MYFACINFFFFYYEQSYLSIYLTNFHDLFTKWKVFVWTFSIRSSFSDSSRDVAMATNFVAKLPIPPTLIALSFRNGMGYRLADTCIRVLNFGQCWGHVIRHKCIFYCGPKNFRGRFQKMDWEMYIHQKYLFIIGHKCIIYRVRKIFRKVPQTGSGTVYSCKIVVCYIFFYL